MARCSFKNKTVVLARYSQLLHIFGHKFLFHVQNLFTLKVLTWLTKILHLQLFLHALPPPTLYRKKTQFKILLRILCTMSGVCGPHQRFFLCHALQAFAAAVCSCSLFVLLPSFLHSVRGMHARLAKSVK